MSEVQVQTECHCLLVDDEEPLRKVLALQLEMEGINVKQAASAEEALVLFGRDEFDVLITDSNMPGLSGEQLLERITLEASGNLPVRFLMTGDVTQELESINANAVIADQLLFKPFETDELIKEIHSRLNP